MTTTTLPRSASGASNPRTRTDGFAVTHSEHGLGYNLPQRMGQKLWRPMFALAVMGFAAGIVLAIVESGTARTEADDLQTLGHLVPGFMFVGFLGVFTAIVFAIARILGEFRSGGGDVQESAGVRVQTLKMPVTAKAMIVLMMMAMMVTAAGIATNFVAAGAFNGTDPGDLIDSARYAAAASGLRRIGVVTYLLAITFGLATIIEVLRFQSIRIGELARDALRRT